MARRERTGRARQTPVVLRTQAQIRAVVQPVRAELIERMKDGAPHAISELAAAMGVRPNALSYHVERLVKAGLLAPAGMRPTAGRPETLYRLVNSYIGVAVSAGSNAASRVAARAVAAALRLAERELAAAMEAGILGAAEATVRPGRRFRARLRPRDVEEVGRAVAAVERVFARRRNATDGTQTSWTHLMVPLVDRS